MERVLFMTRLFTAVGRLHIEGHGKDGKIPVVILKNREYILDIQEFVLWSALNWRILRPGQVQNLYWEKEQETGFCSSRSFDDCMSRLTQRGLVAEGSGETDEQALYRLLSDLYIMPISEIRFSAFVLFSGCACLETYPTPRRKRYCAGISAPPMKRR